MKSLFDPGALDEVLTRLDSLHGGSSRQWGKMSVAQMLEHTARAADMAAGRAPARQLLLGRLISWAFRKKFLGPEPFPKNSPTSPDFIVKDEPEMQRARARLVAVVRELHAQGEAGCDGRVHAFFGRLSGREWGITQYKHLDHHLRQFGA